MLSEFLRDQSEVSHQLFDIPANQFLAKPFDRFTDQLVPQAERKHDTGPKTFSSDRAMLWRMRTRLPSGPHRCPRLAQREANVTRFQ
jgi:hypothetical protein